MEDGGDDIARSIKRTGKRWEKAHIEALKDAVATFGVDGHVTRKKWKLILVDPKFTILHERTAAALYKKAWRLSGGEARLLAARNDAMKIKREQQMDTSSDEESEDAFSSDEDEIESVELRHPGKNEMISLLETAVWRYIKDLAQQKRPVFKLLRTDTKSILEDDAQTERHLSGKRRESKLGKRTCRRHSHLLAVLCFLHKLFMTPSSHLVETTQREIYYALLHIFDTQQEANTAVLDIAGMFSVPRHALGVFAAARGLVYGNLCIVSKEEEKRESRVDCCQATQLITSSILHEDTRLESNATHIIVIEKEGVFLNLVEAGIAKMLPSSVLITGLGFPSIATRTLVKKLSLQFPKAVVVGLFDYNPQGLAILLTYKLGSMRLGFESQVLATPSMRWIGLMHDDVKYLPIAEKHFQRFAPSDEKKAKSLAEWKWIQTQPAYSSELKKMMAHKKKVELQALIELSENSLSKFLIRKLLQHDYI